MTRKKKQTTACIKSLISLYITIKLWQKKHDSDFLTTVNENKMQPFTRTSKELFYGLFLYLINILTLIGKVPVIPQHFHGA